MKIDEVAAPDGSLIADYAAKPGHYADCFETALPGEGTLAQAIVAFYTQPLFQAERLVLRFAAGAPSSDVAAAALARGEVDRFAVWTVEARRADEILLADASGRTKSWLSVSGQLRFGSVVVPVQDRWGRPTLGPVFQSLLGAHKVYSRALLSGMARRMQRLQAP